MTGRGSVLSVSSRAMLDACARLGLDRTEILAAADLDAATVQDPDARIPIGQVEALWQKAYELSNDPDLALHAIEILPFGAYRVIDFLAAHAPTVGDALAKVSDYFPLINGLVRLPYVVHGDHVTFALEAPSCPSVMERSKDVDLDPAAADGSLAYAGLSYRWRVLVLSGEVEKGTFVSYAIRVGTRF